MMNKSAIYIIEHNINRIHRNNIFENQNAIYLIEKNLYRFIHNYNCIWAFLSSNPSFIKKSIINRL